MGLVVGPLSWLTAGSTSGGGEPPAPAPLPEAALDPQWGTYEPDDADAVLDDFGRLVTIEGVGSIRVLMDDLRFVDDHGAPVQTARGYKIVRIRRGAFAGARLADRVATISNGVTVSTFKLIGPVERESSLFDRYVFEPRRRESV